MNLRSRSFRGRGIVDCVRETLRMSGLPAHRLRLEITEFLFLRDEVIICQTLDALRAPGTRLSVDDFGTGYSSLGCLRRCPVGNIKIDRSFVADLAENPRHCGHSAREWIGPWGPKTRSLRSGQVVGSWRPGIVLGLHSPFNDLSRLIGKCSWVCV
ncbi:EAL domain-containing protein [Rubellimicrobium rubrum]|uniref:EAL domain-containing protein n=1 Tax=Rubellimicrobium rubrum TaxID=2585369 RepID=UPI00159BBF49